MSIVPTKLAMLPNIVEFIQKIINFNKKIINTIFVESATCVGNCNGMCQFLYPMLSGNVMS